MMTSFNFFGEKMMISKIKGEYSVGIGVTETKPTRG